MAEHITRNSKNVVQFPRSRKERKRILRESRDGRVRVCSKLRAMCGWVLVASAVLFLLLNFRLFSPSSIRSLTSYAVAGLRQNSGDASAIPYENGSFHDAALYAGGLAYTDGDTLYLARPGGAVTQRLPMSYSQPTVEAAGGYVLAFDRGGHGVTLTNSYQPVAELDLASPIITAGIGRDGRFFVVTDEQGYRTAVAVYDNRGNEVFKWRTSEYYIVSAALSPDGKMLSVLSFKQNGVSLDSQVFFFRLDRDTAQAEATIPGVLGLELAYLSDGTAAALCDNGLYLIDKKGEVTNPIAYSSGDLLAFSFGDNALALATRSFSGSARSDIYLIRSGGKLEGPIASTEEPSALAISRTGLAALTVSGVTVYTSDLTPSWHNSEAVGARRLLLKDDGTLFALYAKNARLFTAHSERSEDIPHDN